MAVNRGLQTAAMLIGGLILIASGILIAFRPSGSMGTAFGWALIGMALLAAGSLLIGTIAARLLAIPWGWIYFRRTGREQPLPPYSIPQALAAREQYEEALAAYQAIASEFPAEITPHVAMIEIVLRHLGDPQRAEGLFIAGMVSLPPAMRGALQAEYDARRRWLAERAEADKRIDAAQQGLHVDQTGDQAYE